MTEIIIALYAASGTIGSLLFLPQVYRMMKSADSRRGMSLITWGGWGIMGTIALIYVATITKDVPLTIFTGVNCAFQWIITIMAVGQRIKDYQNNKAVA